MVLTDGLPAALSIDEYWREQEAIAVVATRGREATISAVDLVAQKRRAIFDGPVLGHVNSWSRLFFPIGMFLAVFGVLNFAELPFGWKDRQQQIGRYLDATVGLNVDWVMPVIWFAKLVELALGLIAIVALLRRSARWLAAATAGWLVWFTGFSAMDVWAADRAELQEHTVYFVMFAVLLGLIFIVSAAEQFLDRLERIRPSRKRGGQGF